MIPSPVHPGAGGISYGNSGRANHRSPDVRMDRLSAKKEVRLLRARRRGDGKRPWAERSFPVASSAGVGGRLIILDHNGQLGLATATRKDLTVHSRCQVTRPYSFTPPTLVGTTLYVRDERHIMALDLGFVSGGSTG